MPFTVNQYRPFPVSEDRAESPPPPLDPNNPLTGLELIVSGLRRDSLASPEDHFRELVAKIEDQGNDLPLLQVVSPGSSPPVDFVYVSLGGSLHEEARPDILEDVRLAIDDLEGIEARWKIGSGKTDKSRQVWFEVEDSTIDVNRFKSKMDNVLRSWNLDYQYSYIPKESRKVFYHFLSRQSLSELEHNPPKIDHTYYSPHFSRYIQPRFGLEIAVNGVGEMPQARAIIDDYLERTYGGSKADPIVRHSRVELNSSVYCVILRDPVVTSRFLSDPFTLFDDSPFTVGTPMPLYVLNSRGIPFTVATATSASLQATLANRASEEMSSKVDALATVVQSLAEGHRTLENSLVQAQANMLTMMADSQELANLRMLLSSAQSDVDRLSGSLDATEMVIMFADDSKRAWAENKLRRTQEQLDRALIQRTTLQTQVQQHQQKFLPAIPDSPSYSFQPTLSYQTPAAAVPQTLSPSQSQLEQGPGQMEVYNDNVQT